MDLWFFFLMHLIWALDLECVPCLIRESTKGKSLLAVYGQLSANPLWSKGRNHITSCTSLHILSLIKIQLFIAQCRTTRFFLSKRNVFAQWNWFSYNYGQQSNLINCLTLKFVKKWKFSQSYDCFTSLS